MSTQKIGDKVTYWMDSHSVDACEGEILAMNEDGNEYIITCDQGWEVTKYEVEGDDEFGGIADEHLGTSVWYVISERIKDEE